MPLEVIRSVLGWSALLGMSAEHDIDLREFLDHLHVFGKSQFGQYNNDVRTGCPGFCYVLRHFLVGHG